MTYSLSFVLFRAAINKVTNSAFLALHFTFPMKDSTRSESHS